MGGRGMEGLVRKKVAWHKQRLHPLHPLRPAPPHLEVMVRTDSVGTEARYVCCAASLSWKAATWGRVGGWVGFWK